MRKTFLLFVLFFLFGLIPSCRYAAVSDYRSGEVYPYTDGLLEPHYVYDLTAVPEIIITISSNEWNTLLTNYDANTANEKYVHADFTFIKNGKEETVTNIGFRVRGNGFSRARPETGTTYHDFEEPNWNYAHFRLNFREYDNDERFHGLRSMNLKWFNGDPTHVREIYCYDLFHRYGVYTAPRTSYTRLTIQIEEDNTPAYFGVYRMVESVDKEFLQERFPGNDDGNLWKCLWPANLTSWSLAGEMGLEDPDNGINYTYDLKTNKKQLDDVAIPQFEEFVANLEGLEGEEFEEWIDSAMDVELFLKALAVNVLVGMWDDYWANQNNFYFYFDESGKAYFIPYDYDNTLGIGWNDAANMSVFNWGPMDDTRPLVYKIMQVEKYREFYADCLGELIDVENDYFHPENSIARLWFWRKMIAPYTQNDIGFDDDILDKGPYWGDVGYHVYDGEAETEPYNYFKRVALYTRIQLDEKDLYGWDEIYDF